MCEDARKIMPSVAQTIRHFDFQVQKFIELEDQKVDTDSASVRLTARVTRLGWEGGEALETGSAQARKMLKNAAKRGAYPKSGARIVRHFLSLADFITKRESLVNKALR